MPRRRPPLASDRRPSPPSPDELPELLLGVVLAKERLPDQKRLPSGCREARDVVAGGDAALRQPHGAGRNLCGERLQPGEVRLERSEIPGVDPEDVGRDRRGARDLFAAMRFDDHGQSALRRAPAQVRELFLAERADDEEDGVGSEGNGEVELRLREKKVLQEHRQPRNPFRPRHPLGAAPEVVLLRDDRDRRGMPAAIGQGERLDFAVRPHDDVSRRRGPRLEFGDDPHAGFPQGRHEPRSVAPRLRRSLRGVFPALETKSLVGQDPVEDRAHAGVPAARSLSNVATACPSSIATRARSYPSSSLSARSTTTSPSAAFNSTASRRGPFSPSRSARSIAALEDASPPASSAASTARCATSPGSYRQGRVQPSWISMPEAGTPGMSSSKPLAEWKTTARSDPRVARASARSRTSSGRPTPIICRVAPAGFARGPSALKMVRTPSSLLTVPSSFIAGWNAGAKRKTSPISSSNRPARSGSRSIAIPAAARTSADPTREEIERLPCLATQAPAPAATIAVAVERLNMSRPIPPGPHVSSSGARDVETRRIRLRSAETAPAISSDVSPRVAIPIRIAPFCASVALPSMRSPKTRSARSRDRGCLAATILRASATFGVTAPPNRRARHGGRAGKSSPGAFRLRASEPIPGGTARRTPASNGARGP